MIFHDAIDCGLFAYLSEFDLSSVFILFRPRFLSSSTVFLMILLTADFVTASFTGVSFIFRSGDGTISLGLGGNPLDLVC